MRANAQTRTWMNLMKRIHFLILTLSFVMTFSLSNRSFAQDYVRYATLTGHTNNVNSVAFNPNGSMLTSGGSDKTIRLWDVITGAPKTTLTGHTGYVMCVAFSPDGQVIASGGGAQDATIRLWDSTTGSLRKTLTGHTETVWCVSFSPDGRILVSGSSDWTIRFWDVTTGTHLKTLTGQHFSKVSSVIFSPNGHTLASGSSGGRNIYFWNAITGTHLKTFKRDTGSIESLSFSPDGHTLASGSGWDDNTIYLWDVATGIHLKTLKGHTGRSGSVSFSPDGHTLASGSEGPPDDDYAIHLWDVATGIHLKTLKGHTSWVSSIAFSPSGSMLASGSWDNTISLWRVSSARSVDTDSSTSLKFSANQVYNNAIRGVMWIVNPGIGEGSGVLIDKKFKFAITNAHVTGTQNVVDVYFPAPNEKGELIKDRNFYLANSGVLKRLGYYTKGRVVAKNGDRDLAIIRLDGLPETAREIDWNFTSPATNAGDLVYILGNPGGQDLWRWTLGEFLKDHGDFSHIQSDVFGGNSGGPVLNKQGILIGIVAQSDRHMNALAIPVRYINGLLSGSHLEHSRSHR